MMRFKNNILCIFLIFARINRRDLISSLHLSSLLTKKAKKPTTKLDVKFVQNNSVRLKHAFQKICGIIVIVSIFLYSNSVRDKNHKMRIMEAHFCCCCLFNFALVFQRFQIRSISIKSEFSSKYKNIHRQDTHIVMDS